MAAPRSADRKSLGGGEHFSHRAPAGPGIDRRGRGTGNPAGADLQVDATGGASTSRIEWGTDLAGREIRIEADPEAIGPGGITSPCHVRSGRVVPPAEL
jgi:hypothetical protein